MGTERGPDPGPSPSDAWLEARGYTREQFESSRARFSWSPGDVTWLDDDGRPMSDDQVAKIQADAAAAEAIERDKAERAAIGDIDDDLYE